WERVYEKWNLCRDYSSQARSVGVATCVFHIVSFANLAGVAGRASQIQRKWQVGKQVPGFGRKSGRGRRESGSPRGVGQGRRRQTLGNGNLLCDPQQRP